MPFAWPDVQAVLPSNVGALVRAQFDAGIVTLPVSGVTPGNDGQLSGSPYALPTGWAVTGAGQGAELIDILATNGIIGYLNRRTAANPLWSGVLGPAVGMYNRIGITSANILGMFTTPVSVIPAPGAGLTIVVDQVLLELKNTATSYAGGGNVTLVYHGTSVNPHAGSIAPGEITKAAGTYMVGLGPFAAGAASTVEFPANTGIDITNATAAFTTGTGTAILHIWYGIVTA